jgi:hypothetical protein
MLVLNLTLARMYPGSLNTSVSRFPKPYAACSNLADRETVRLGHHGFCGVLAHRLLSA